MIMQRVLRQKEYTIYATAVNSIQRVEANRVVNFIL